MEFTLLAAAAIAGACAYAMLWWEARHGNAATCTANLWEVGFVSVIAGIFIGRIVAMLIDGVNPIVHPMDVILVRSGVSTVGASLGALAVFAWQARRQPVAMADGIAAAALAGLAGWQAGCLVRGTCLGTASDFPWAIAQAGSSVTRHPVGVYAALAFGAAAVVVAWWKAYRQPPAGAPAAIAVIVAAGTRLGLEPLQPSISGGPVWFYATALAVGLGALVWSILTRR